MGLFDKFRNQNDYDERINNNSNEQKLLEKIELKDKIIKKLENDLDSKNNEIKQLKAEIDNLKLGNELNNHTHNENIEEFQSSISIDNNLNKESKNDDAVQKNDSDKITEMREKLISAIKEKTKIKSYHIIPTEITDGDIFMSKFGGLGYWDNSMEYPKDDQDNQLVLLAQINFDKDKFDDPNLPSSGLLQFYILPDELYGAEFDASMNKNNYKVIFHEKVNYDVKKEDLENIKTNMMLSDEDECFPFNKELKIEFKESYDYINPVNAGFKDVLSDIVKEEFNIDVSDTPLYKVFGEGIMDYLDEKLIASGSKLLGYPYFTQNDPRESEKYKDYKILLFQMDSDAKLDIMWGDFGIANFFITKSKDFSDVFYTWDCT